MAAGEAPPSPIAFSRLALADVLRKSTGTDGGSGGSGKLVGLFVLRSSDNFCAGYIGNGKAKVCLSRSCTVQSHAHKFIFPDGVDALTFIDTGVAGAVWASPFIEPLAFGDAWDCYRGEQCTATAWQVLFEALLDNPSLTKTDVNNIDDANRVRQPSFTPFKRRKLANVMTSPSKSKDSFQDVTFVPLTAEAGPTEALSIDSVLQQWRTVGLNLELLHGMASSTKKGDKELDELVVSTTNQMEVKISGLRAVVGERPRSGHHHRLPNADKPCRRTHCIEQGFGTCFDATPTDQCYASRK